MYANATQDFARANATCMLVEIIAKNSQNIAWQCSVDNQSMKHEQIRVSIDKFYELVTGNANAFAQLCQILPNVIQDVLANEKTQIIENTVLSDIQEQNIEHILTSLYLITFKKYQGFDNFHLGLS